MSALYLPWSTGYKFLQIKIFKIFTSPDVFYTSLANPMYGQMEKVKFHSVGTFPEKVPRATSLHSQCTLFARELRPSSLINSVELDNCIGRPCLWAKPSEMFISPFSESAPGQWNQRGEESQADQTLNNFHLWLHSFSLWSAHFSTPAYWSGQFSPPWSLQLTDWQTWAPTPPPYPPTLSSIPQPSPSAPRVIVRSL